MSRRSTKQRRAAVRRDFVVAMWRQAAILRRGFIRIDPFLENFIRDRLGLPKAVNQ